MINTSKKPFYVPQNKLYNRQSTSFGINVTRHAYKRIEERGIGFKEVINTIRSGRKFLTFHDKGRRIVNIHYHGNGKVPEGTTIVITDTTGDILITAMKTPADTFEMVGEKLKYKYINKRNDFELYTPWRKKFDEKIFGEIRILSTAQDTAEKSSSPETVNIPLILNA